MLQKEDFEVLIESIKSKLDDVNSALISEDLLNVLANYTSALENINELTEKIDALETEKSELLMVNGKLFQKIGFDKEEEEKSEEETETEEEYIDIEEVIDEKGELI